MIAGRAGSQKSGLALWWTAKMKVPTLYFSADSSGFTTTARLATTVTGHSIEAVEEGMKGEQRQFYYDALEAEASHMQFAFGSPIIWRNLELEMDAYVEVWNRFPDVIVFDNLMDFQGADTDYGEQMAVMSGATELARGTGATVIVLHHATSKSDGGRYRAWAPPPKGDIKNGLDEKPELILGVALDNESLKFNVSVLKQRMGPQDPSAQRYVTFRADPDHTSFFPL